MPGAPVRSAADKETESCSCLGCRPGSCSPCSASGSDSRDNIPTAASFFITKMNLECRIGIANLAGMVDERLHVWHAVIAASRGIGLVLHQGLRFRWSGLTCLAEGVPSEAKMAKKMLNQAAFADESPRHWASSAVAAPASGVVLQWRKASVDEAHGVAANP